MGIRTKYRNLEMHRNMSRQLINKNQDDDETISIKENNAITKAIRRNSYRHSLTGEEMCIDFRKLQMKKLHDDLKNVNNFFHPSSSLKWTECDDSHGSISCKYAKQTEVLESGFLFVEPGGLWNLHWHKETEKYIVFGGRGIITVGDQEMDINADEDPTIVTIPGNVPHQVFNPYKKVLKLYYFFPEGERLDSDISYFFADGAVEEVIKTEQKIHGMFTNKRT